MHVCLCMCAHTCMHRHTYTCRQATHTHTQICTSTKLALFLSLSLSHIHTHTNTLSLSPSLPPSSSLSLSHSSPIPFSHPPRSGGQDVVSIEGQVGARHAVKLQTSHRLWLLLPQVEQLQQTRTKFTPSNYTRLPKEQQLQQLLKTCKCGRMSAHSNYWQQF